MNLFKSFKGLLIIGTIVEFASLMVVVFYNEKLPDVVPTHFGIDGQANAFGSKWYILLFSIITISFLFGIFVFVASKAKNVVSEIVKTFLGVSAMFLIIQIGLCESILRSDFLIFENSFRLAMMALVLSLVFTLKNVPQNEYIGVRTPWTLSDNTNWKLTHAFASNAYFWGAIAIFLSKYAKLNGGVFIISTLAAILPGIAALLYSYKIHKSKVISG